MVHLFRFHLNPASLSVETFDSALSLVSVSFVFSVTLNVMLHRAAFK